MKEDTLKEITRQIEELELLLASFHESPLMSLAKAADPTLSERLQRAMSQVRSTQGVTLHTWRVMKGKKGAPPRLGYLLEWITPPDPQGNNVLVLPGYAQAEPLPSRWEIWQEQLPLLDSLAFEGALLEAESEKLA